MLDRAGNRAGSALRPPGIARDLPRTRRREMVRRLQPSRSMRREPGKSARSMETFRPPTVQRAPGRGSAVQRRYGGADQAAAPPEAEEIHRSARRGISGSATDLPFLDVIQQSFGPHDIGGVRAHTDGAAWEASAAMGASAYATGDHIAFGGTPDLHTAAHEAAHVVQQRGGVQLKGGVGEEGDFHERHADAVADRVVRGASAVDLLDEVATAPASSGSPVGGVQRRAIQLQQAGGAPSPRLEAFSRIHYYAMPGLLRALEGLRPFTAEDYELARRHYGPRLVVAMKTVQTRAPWGSGELSALPADQQRDIQSYLGVSNMLPEGDAGFSSVWNAHPHDYKPDPTQNTSSEEVREEHGMPSVFQNTCACRLSVMLNGTGNPITPAKTRAAGIARAPFYSEKTKQYYIIAANEMWAYLSRHFRGPDVVFPARGEYRTAEEFDAVFMTEIIPHIIGRKGIVAFETIFGYGGTGHVDVFDGATLSDSNTWYACHRLRLWYVVVP